MQIKAGVLILNIGWRWVIVIWELNDSRGSYVPKAEAWINNLKADICTENAFILRFVGRDLYLVDNETETINYWAYK